jgi:hypothetical protein
MNIKKYARILCAVALLCGLSVAAQAELRDDVAVKVPFDFVVGKKTLPAGTYKVTSSSPTNSTLRLTSLDNGASAVVLPFVGQSVNVDMPRLSFQQVGGQHFLSAIETAHNVYSIRVSPSRTMETAARLHDNGSASGDSAGTLIR